MSWTVIDSPVGELRLVEHDGALTQIEFHPFRDHDGRPRGSRDDDQPAARRGRAPAARVLRPRPQGVRPPAGAGRHRVPAAGLAGAARDRLRRDLVVRRARPPARQVQRRLARGRPRQRPQPDPDRDPVPPRHRRQRHPHRLRRRPRPQAEAARARARRAVLIPPRASAPSPWRRSLRSRALSLAALARRCRHGPEADRRGASLRSERPGRFAPTAPIPLYPRRPSSAPRSAATLAALAGAVARCAVSVWGGRPEVGWQGGCWSAATVVTLRCAGPWQRVPSARPVRSWWWAGGRPAHRLA